jgi:hypothetical protein
MKPAVFINYRSEDSHGYAALLYTELAHRVGDDLVFLDAESIPAETACRWSTRSTSTSIADRAPSARLGADGGLVRGVGRPIGVAFCVGTWR